MNPFMKMDSWIMDRLDRAIFTLHYNHRIRRIEAIRVACLMWLAGISMEMIIEESKLSWALLIWGPIILAMHTVNEIRAARETPDQHNLRVLMLRLSGLMIWVRVVLMHLGLWIFMMPSTILHVAKQEWIEGAVSLIGDLGWYFWILGDYTFTPPTPPKKKEQPKVAKESFSLLPEPVRAS